jgi:hypothetical protein
MGGLHGVASEQQQQSHKFGRGLRVHAVGLLSVDCQNINYLGLGLATASAAPDSCFSLTVAVWRCGGVAVWQCGSVAVWQCGSVAVWQCGSVAVWQCGSGIICHR